MIDEKKIEEAARDYINKNGYFAKYDEEPCDDIEFAYKDAVHWAIEQFLKDLWHPAEEEPKNLEYIIFASEIFGETYFYTKQRDNSKQSWEIEAACHGIDQWAYRNDIVSLTLKGGKQ